MSALDKPLSPLTVDVFYGRPLTDLVPFFRFNYSAFLYYFYH